MTQLTGLLVRVTALSLALTLTACTGPPPRPAQPSPTSAKSPTVALLGEPSPGSLARAEQLVNGMRLRDLAGQVIVAGWFGRKAPVEQVRRLRLGGIIAIPGPRTPAVGFARVNRQVGAVIRKRGIPPFLAVDQEGGTVSRISYGVPVLPTFMAAGAADRVGLTKGAAQASADALRRLGFTVVLAPVADVTLGAADPTIGSRSAGSSPQLVSRHVLAAVGGIRDAGMLPVAKHFPGHGSVSTDTHRGLAVQSATLAELGNRDLVPFETAIAGGLTAVMTAHVVVRHLDRGEPATTSKPVVSGLLRADLRFGGLVVSDALNMAGVQRAHPGARAGVAALRAGVDVLLLPPNPRQQRDAIMRAVRSGQLPKQRLKEAAARIIATLWDARQRQVRSVHPAAIRALSRASITSVAGACQGRLIPRRVWLSGSATGRAWLAPLLRARGVRVLPGKQAGAMAVTLIGFRGRVPDRSGVAVALDRPGVLGRVRARVKIAAFGVTRESMAAVADVLVGRRQAPGKLPVVVSGVRRQGCP